MIALGVAVLAVAALAGLALTPAVIRFAVLRGVYDEPAGGRRVHTQPIPRLGGVVVCAATVTSLALALSLGRGFGLAYTDTQWRFFMGVLYGGGILFVAGLIDDVRTLRPSAKFIAQVAAALVVYLYGFRVETLTLGHAEISLGWVALPLTIVWVVGVTNAFNLIDGLDGLATGIALVALGTTLAVALWLGNSEVVVVCLALIGALLGFLRYNFNPARIFLGDSGSLLVGFMLAVLSVHGAQMSATAVLTIVPLFALALPLIDTALAMLRRWLRGVPLSEADARHIHHRLLAMGFTHRRAVFVLHAAAVSLAMMGLVIAFAPPAGVTWIAALGGGASLLILLAGLRRLQYHEFSVAGQVVVSGTMRMRRIIRDQIHARDVAQIIKCAESRQEIDAVLEDNASNFGFLYMELCREGSAGRGRFNGHAARAWKLDYPVAEHEGAEGDPYVLRIWCHSGEGFRPFGAERVAHILAPTIEEWMRGAERRRPVVLLRSEKALAGEIPRKAVR